jgi:hypothetical protein
MSIIGLLFASSLAMVLFFYFIFWLIVSFMIDYFWSKQASLKPKKTSQAKELMTIIQQIQLSGTFPSSNSPWPEYKNYTSLMVQLLNYARTFGAHYKEMMKELRAGIQKDFQFDLLLKQLIHRAFFQFLIISIITWFFYIFAQAELSLQLNFIWPMIILILQSSGLFIFLFFRKLQQKSYFKGFEAFTFSLYAFKSLSLVGLPSRDIVRLSKFETCLNYHPSLKSIHERLMQVVQLFLKQGHSTNHEIQLLLEELWFLKEEQLKNFQLKMEQLKLLILALFFLPAYLVLLMGLFQSFSFSF